MSDTPSPGAMSRDEELFWMEIYKDCMDGVGVNYSWASTAATERANRAVLDFRHARKAKPESDEDLRRHIL